MVHCKSGAISSPAPKSERLLPQARAQHRPSVSDLVPLRRLRVLQAALARPYGVRAPQGATLRLFSARRGLSAWMPAARWHFAKANRALGWEGGIINHFQGMQEIALLDIETGLTTVGSCYRIGAGSVPRDVAPACHGRDDHFLMSLAGSDVSVRLGPSVASRLGGNHDFAALQAVQVCFSVAVIVGCEASVDLRHPGRGGPIGRPGQSTQKPRKESRAGGIV